MKEYEGRLKRQRSLAALGMTAAGSRSAHARKAPSLPEQITDRLFHDFASNLGDRTS
jgi:hypothetical protein